MPYNNIRTCFKISGKSHVTKINTSLCWRFLFVSCFAFETFVAMLRRQYQRVIERRPGRDHPVHQADALGLVTGDPASGQDQVGAASLD